MAFDVWLVNRWVSQTWVLGIFSDQFDEFRQMYIWSCNYHPKKYTEHFCRPRTHLSCPFTVRCPQPTQAVSYWISLTVDSRSRISYKCTHTGYTLVSRPIRFCQQFMKSLPHCQLLLIPCTPFPRHLCACACLHFPRSKLGFSLILGKCGSLAQILR